MMTESLLCHDSAYTQTRSAHAIKMRNKLIILALMITGFYFSCQSSKSTPAKIKNEAVKLDSSKANKHKLLTFDSESYPERESKYTDSSGNHVIIQNSVPRGGPYTSPTGERFGLGIFWNRVLNETTTPVELTINFPVDSFAIAKSYDAYLKLFIPPGTMTIDKISSYGYGSGVESFLDTGINKPISLQRTIKPKEEYLFYIGILMMDTHQQNGPLRAGFTLNDQELFYRINLPPFGSSSVPCGQISLKKIKQ